MRVALAVVVAAVLVATAGVIAWSLRSPATVAEISAATGGTITTDDGVSVRFAPGALSRDTEVRIAPRPSITAPAGLTWLTEPVDIALGDAELRTSATVTLPLSDAATGDLVTLVARDHQGVWSSQGGVVDRGAGTITATVGSLSITSAGRASVRAPDLLAGSGARDATGPDCGTTRSQRWTARSEDDAVRTCVAAGAADRAALMRVSSNRATGQFAELGGYPPMRVAAPGATSVADTVWRLLAGSDRDHTYLPGGGTLDLALPGSYTTIDFVVRGGLDVAVAEYVVEVMSDAYVPTGVTVKAVRCAIALPLLGEISRTGSPRRLPELGGQVQTCVTGAFEDHRILPGGAAEADEELARQQRGAVTRAVLTAVRGLPPVLEALLRGDAVDHGQRLVVADRSPVIPHKALNEPGGAIPAAVIKTQERLYAAARRDDLTGALPPAGLVFTNSSLAGGPVTDAVVALVTTPPLRWPCDETARDGYVYGLADPNLLTYPARLTDMGMAPEDIGIVRQTAGGGKNYRLCIAMDGTWTSLTHDLPPGEFPTAAAAELARSGECGTATNAFLPPDSVCRSVVRTELDGDGHADTLLLYRRADRWTARAVLAAGRVSDLALPFAGDEQPALVADLDLDGEPGEEVALGAGATFRLVSLTPAGLVLVNQEFTANASLPYTSGIGCSDLDGDGRPELVEAGAAFDRDPATGAITAARTTEIRWTWNGKRLERGEKIVRQLDGAPARAAAGPPYRDVTCSWR